MKSRPPRPYELEIVGYRDVGVVLFLIQALLVAQVFGLRSKEQTAMQGAVSRTASAGWDWRFCILWPGSATKFGCLGAH